jgi:hypothetical protein
MSIKQVSVFVENRQGALCGITDALAKNGIDMNALTLADTADFCIMRMIVTDTEKAREVLSEIGYLVKLTDVVAVEMENTPGALSQVITGRGEAGMDIEYLYAFIAVCGKNARVVIRVDDNEKAETLLSAKNIKIIKE